MKPLNLIVGGLLIGTLAPRVHGQWTTDALSLGRYALTAVTHDGKAFFAGGDAGGNTIVTRVDIYDPAADPHWSQFELSSGRLDIASVSVGTYAMFAGGSDDESGWGTLDTVDIYDSSLGAPDDPAAWSVHPLSEARIVGAATSVGTKAFFAGGSTINPATASDVVDIYDSALGPPTDPGAWSVMTLATPRARIAATTVGSKALFAGGGDFPAPGPTNPNTVNTVDIYDDATGTWSTATLSQARMGATAVTVGTKAIFAGGRGGVTTNRVDIYDDSTGTWSTAALSVGREYSASAAVGGHAVFIGGIGSGPSSLPMHSVDIYDSVNDSWSTDELYPNRYFHAATSVGGQAFFAGGTAPGNNFHDEVVVIGPTIENCQPEVYCSATPNSSGTFATMGWQGTPYINTNDLVLSASDAPANVNGIFYYGMDQTFQVFGGAVRCIGGSVIRLQPPLSTDAQGVATRPIDLTQPPFSTGPGQINVNDTWNFQFWFRDPTGTSGSGFNMSRGLEVRFCE